MKPCERCALAVGVINARISIIVDWDIPNADAREAEFCKREVFILQAVRRDIIECCNDARGGHE